MVWLSSAGKWAKKQIQAFFRRAWRSPSLRPVGELEGTGNRLGTTSCSALEPSLRPSSSLGPGLEERWTSPPSLSLQPTSSGHFPGPQSLRTGLLTWTACGDRTCWVGCLAPSRMRAVQNVGTLLWRSCQMRSVSAYPRWDITRWNLCLETLPSFDSARKTENNIHLVEIYSNIITWPWPNVKHKGYDTKKSVTTYHNSLWNFFVIVLNWKCSVTLSS